MIHNTTAQLNLESARKLPKREIERDRVHTPHVIIGAPETSR